MRKIIIIALLGLLSAAHAYGPYSATMVRVIDGDTVEMSLNTEPDHYWVVKVRIAGVDTPETSNRYPACQIPLGLAAKAYTAQWFQGATDIQVSEVELGSYVHRAVGVVTAIKDGIRHNLGDDLLKSGHARVEVIGQTGKGWCK